MRLKLQLRQSMIMAGRMLQSIEILQMPIMQLRDYIYALSLENPVIEINSNYSASEKTDTNMTNNTEMIDWIEQSSVNSHEQDISSYIWEQLLDRNLSEQDSRVIRYIICSLNKQGYFEDKIENVAHKFKISQREVTKLLKLVQQLEPAGIGACNLQECLLLQLRRLPQDTQVAKIIVKKYLELFSKNQLDKIAKLMNIDVEQVRKSGELIRKLNPIPGNAIAETDKTEFAIPDLILVKEDNEYKIVLNEKLYPDIQINTYYTNLIKLKNDELNGYLVTKIRQAYWLQECIAKRNKTLRRVAERILSVQEEFFLHKSNNLNPLSVMDIALALDVHESTVSRALRGKFIQCYQGVLPLNFFLEKAVHVAEDADIGVKMIRKQLRAFIETEDKKKPLSDEKIRQKFQEKNINISRRTIAKYRTQEKIATASCRKTF